MMQMLHQFVTLNAMENATTAQSFLRDMISPIRPTLLGMRTKIYEEGLKWKAEGQYSTSQFQFLELMPFDETTKEGLEACIKRILETVGSITTNEKGVSQKTSLTKIRRLFAYGDQLTMKHLETLKEQVLKKTIESDKPEHWIAFLDSLNTIHVILGDLHVEMHILAAIFHFAYGGFLQPIQHVLGWLRIQRNTVPRHQQSTKLFLLVLTQMKRYMIQTWAKTLRAETTMTLVHDTAPSRNRRERLDPEQGSRKRPRLGKVHVDILPILPIANPPMPSVTARLMPNDAARVPSDAARLHKDTLIEAVPLSNLEQQNATTIVLTLAGSLQQFLEEKRKSKDAVVRFFMQIMDLGEQFEEYRRATHDGDSILCELLRIELLPVFQVMGKSNYVDLFATVMEVLYQEMGRSDLEEQRLNDRIRLSLGKGQIPLDHLCELMNLWTKRQSNTSMDTAIHRSLYLALMQISHKFAKDLIQRPVGNFKDSAKSKTTLNQKIVSWLIVDCGRMLEEDDREEIPTRFLWQHAKAARARFEEEAKEGRTTNRTKKQAEFTETETKEVEENNDEPETDIDSVDELDDHKADAQKWPLNKLANKDIIVEGIKGLKGLKEKRSSRSLKLKRLYHYVREGEALRKRLEKESREEVDQLPMNTLTPSRPPPTIIDALKNFLPEGVDPNSMQVQATKKLTEGATTLALAAPTGSGKSLVIAGTALLRGGITVVFEPLLAVGADQAREMKKAIAVSQSFEVKNRMTCIHLDCLPEETRSLQLKKLQNLADKKMHTM
jgi:hypothetical protein